MRRKLNFPKLRQHKTPLNWYWNDSFFNVSQCHIHVFLTSAITIKTGEKHKIWKSEPYQRTLTEIRESSFANLLLLLCLCSDRHEREGGRGKRKRERGWTEEREGLDGGEREQRRDVVWLFVLKVGRGVMAKGERGFHNGRIWMSGHVASSGWVVVFSKNLLLRGALCWNLE